MNKFGLLFIGLLQAAVAWGQCRTPSGGMEGKIAEHGAYSLEFIPELRIAEWVLYEVTATEITGARYARSDDFREDPALPGLSPDADDYAGSGFDRGHLAPAADMAYDAQAMSESFLMTNMTPQHPSLNRGRWKTLETAVRGWAVEKEALCVVAGPVLTPGLDELASGIVVPEWFYKVVYDPAPVPSAVGYLFPNAKCPEPLPAYAVPIDRIEALTGLDLFPGLDERIEQTITTW